eukprot:5774746-Prymnesium_polylepis.1
MRYATGHVHQYGCTVSTELHVARAAWPEASARTLPKSRVSVSRERAGLLDDGVGLGAGLAP